MLLESGSKDYEILEDSEMMKEVKGLNRLISEEMINEKLEQMIL